MILYRELYNNWYQGIGIRKEMVQVVIAWLQFCLDNFGDSIVQFVIYLFSKTWNSLCVSIRISKYKSTWMTIICLREKLVKALENGKVGIAIFIDFRKAFDTVDHNILWSNLGPLLFVLYINDLALSSPKLFAKPISFVQEKLPSLIKTLNTEVMVVVAWLDTSKCL